MINKLKKCRFCSSTDYAPLFIKDNYEIAKCNSCNFIFLNFAPTKGFLVNYYSEDFFNDKGTKHGFSNYEKESSNIQKSFKERIEILRKHQNSGSLLDIGCATGTFMEIATNYWKVFGIEISPYATKVAKKKGLNISGGTLEDRPYKNAKFDVITLWDTIEHLPDPVNTIKLLGNMVKLNSIIALTTGDVGSMASRISGKYWHLYNIPQHLSYFNRRSISDLLNKGGFKIKEITYPPVYFTLDYILFRLLTFYNLKFAMPLYNMLSNKNLLDINLKINLHDIMMVVAQKK